MEKEALQKLQRRCVGARGDGPATPKVSVDDEKEKICEVAPVAPVAHLEADDLVAAPKAPTKPWWDELCEPDEILGMDDAKMMDDIKVFDDMMTNLLGRETGQVRADVAAHTEKTWGVQADLGAARRQLFEDAAALVCGGLADSTRASYKSGCRTYEHFCNVFKFRAYDVTEVQMTLFVAFSVKRVRVRTVEQYLKAIKSACVDRGFPAPVWDTMPRLQRALQGARYAEKARKKDGYYRLPITLQMLEDMVRVVQQRAEWAEKNGEAPIPVASGMQCPIQRITMYLVAFYGALRPGELSLRRYACGSTSTELRMKHLHRQQVHNPSTGKPLNMWTLFLESSKTDQLGTKSDIVLGETGKVLCAVKALDLLVQTRKLGGHDMTDGETLVFPGKCGTRAVPYEEFLEAIRADLHEAGYDVSKYAGHSFRIGCATMLALQGVPDHVIQAVGRWESDCYKRYIRVDPMQRAMLAATLQGQASA